MVALVRIAFLLLMLTPAHALAARSDWSRAEQSELRLLLSPEAGGEISGAIQIVLEPGWHTYWRTPGEAGVPPKFDFSGSENVAAVEVRYPVPERLDDGVSVSLIYRDEAVFPIEVTPLRAGEPVTLRLAARFGVCSDVCIPTEAAAALTLSPDEPTDPLAEAVVEGVAPRIPKVPNPGQFDIEHVGAESDALIIDVRMPDSSYADLFAEPPAGWYLGQPEFSGRAAGVSRYRLSLAGRPHDAAVSGQTFRFVAVAGGEAIETAVTLP
jgi:DsbC/DsbD-like thiol-disulfide interchange protein